jgi:hypothetical protein
MLNNVFIENSLKSKLNIIGEFGHTLDIVGKPVRSEQDLMKVIRNFLKLKV